MSSGERCGRTLENLVTELAAATAVAPHALLTFTRNGLLAPVRPDRLVRMGLALWRWGMCPATLFAANAARDPSRPAVIDERETLTAGEVDRRSSVVAAALRERGVEAGDAVALLARNSSDFVVSQVAIGKLGADVLYANTGFGAPQLADVLAAERARAVVVDEEFVELVDEAAPDLPRLIAWPEDAGSPPEDSVLGLTASAAAVPDLSRPSRSGRHVILTSGTTGRPKGAARSAPTPLAGVVELAAFLEAIPLPARGTTVMAAPMFHAWGLGNLTIGAGLGSTLVMRRRFDPAATMRLVNEHDASVLVAVPVMLQRILQVSEPIDTPTLRIVALSGSALPPAVAERFMDRYGDVIYSLYGSTEVAYVSVASPRDLREAPGTAGRVLRGVKVRIVDAEGRDVPRGQTGRIFAGSLLAFEGYTSGEDKDRLDGLAATGDVGRFDDEGRLYVEGRDDDMIVSGGENVFPAEVEEALHRHPDVADVAVIGVPDEEFGQVLEAHVVLRSGARADEQALRSYVKRELAGYKVPRRIHFHDALPRNETGKVVKRELGASRAG